MGSRCAPREQREALAIIQLHSLKAGIKEEGRGKKTHNTLFSIIGQILPSKFLNNFLL